MTAYYNEIDPYAAQWLRNLIDAGHIAPGVVDERSIEDICPRDLDGFTQCHFFAGIGVWSYALRAAGWADDRPVWTGSCPCQPFSAAGKGAGFADERHLWPAWHHLIRERRPAVVFGEQVASSDAGPWLDLVQDDVEAMGYAFGAVPFPSAGVGAPHIRDRLYWVADATNGGRGEERAHARRGVVGDRSQGLTAGSVHGGGHRWLGHAGSHDDACEVEAASAGRAQTHRSADIAGGPGSASGGLADTDGGHPGTEREQRSGEQRQQPQDGGLVQLTAAGPTNGLWRAADWLLCRDGKWRPVEPGTFPLAHGAPARVGRLRAYGNAINAEAARIFIECVMA